MERKTAVLTLLTNLAGVGRDYQAEGLHNQWKLLPSESFQHIFGFSNTRVMNQ